MTKTTLSKRSKLTLTPQKQSISDKLNHDLLKHILSFLNDKKIFTYLTLQNTIGDAIWFKRDENDGIYRAFKQFKEYYQAQIPANVHDKIQPFITKHLSAVALNTDMLIKKDFSPLCRIHPSNLSSRKWLDDASEFCTDIPNDFFLKNSLAHEYLFLKKNYYFLSMY